MSKLRDQILDLCGGNRGALSVLCDAYERLGYGVLQKIQSDKRVRGAVIWEIYKDIAQCDIEKLPGALLEWQCKEDARARREELEASGVYEDSNFSGLEPYFELRSTFHGIRVSGDAPPGTAVLISGEQALVVTDIGEEQKEGEG